MSKKKFFAVFGVFTLLIVGIYIYYNHAGISADTSSARAVDTSYAVDSKTKWDQGALKNVDDSTGAAKMDTKHMWESNFTGWTQTNSIVTHPGYDGFEFDDWCLSQINRDGGMCIHSIHGTFQAILDMGSIHWYPSLSFIPNLDANSSGWNGYPYVDTCLDIETSEDNANYSSLYHLCTTQSNNHIVLSRTYTQPFTARYMRFTATDGGAGVSDEQASSYTVAFITPAFSTNTSIHTSGATQIGSPNVVQWNSFTPDQDVPANTSIKYRFRTSPEGSSWTSWSAYQTPSSGQSVDLSGLVTSKSGDTFYKYLQVESTLTNTDGQATPTINSYNVGFHTSIKPNQPAAQTAVIQ